MAECERYLGTGETIQDRYSSRATIKSIKTFHSVYITHKCVGCVGVFVCMNVCVTFGWLQQFVVLCTPAHRMQLCSHDVTPEVSAAFVAVATVAQQQQLAACCDDGSNPVCVSTTPIGHLQLHPSLETALQTQLHLNKPKTPGSACHPKG